MSNQNGKREIAGVDIFIEAPFQAKLPTDIGGLKLAHVASRGTKLKGNELEKRILDVGWLCARYLFDTPHPANSETDAAILRAMETIGASYAWSSAIKLYHLDGHPQFS
ncbi:MAG: hypothetical protein RIR26_1485 [Pseudomonadota bacterium]|jgi:hypothetical protein